MGLLVRGCKGWRIGVGMVELCEGIEDKTMVLLRAELGYVKDSWVTVVRWP